MPTPGVRSCGFNVEIEYFSWLAEHGKLLVGRISEKTGPTVALGYCVPEDDELVFVTLKRRSQVRYRKFGIGTALFFMFLDHIYDSGLATPLNIRSVLKGHSTFLRPVPIHRPQLEFSNREALAAFLARFGDTARATA